MFAHFIIISESGINGGYVDGWHRHIFTHGLGISLSPLTDATPIFRAKARTPFVQAEKRVIE